MTRATVAQLRAEIEALKARIAQLEARPVFAPQWVYQPGPALNPQPIPWAPYQPPMWPHGTITC